MAFVQSKSTSRTTPASTTIAVTMTSNVAAGNLLVVGVASGQGSGTTVADTLGNTLTQIQETTDTVQGIHGFTFYAKNIAGGADTITATFAASIDTAAITVHEVSGVDTISPLDVFTGNFQNTAPNTTDGVTSGSVTTTTNGQYIFGVMWITEPPTSNAITAGTGYTQRETQQGTGTFEYMSEDRIQAAAGAIAATFTKGAPPRRTVAQIATFKAAAAAEGGPSMPVYRVRLRQF